MNMAPPESQDARRFGEHVPDVLYVLQHEIRDHHVNGFVLDRPARLNVVLEKLDNRLHACRAESLARHRQHPGGRVETCHASGARGDPHRVLSRP
jgi:hypothetical protein